jgi:hypothetical protein
MLCSWHILRPLTKCSYLPCPMPSCLSPNDLVKHCHALGRCMRAHTHSHTHSLSPPFLSPARMQTQDPKNPPVSLHATSSLSTIQAAGGHRIRNIAGISVELAILDITPDCARNPRLPVYAPARQHTSYFYDTKCSMCFLPGRMRAPAMPRGNAECASCQAEPQLLLFLLAVLLTRNTPSKTAAWE